jgi:hypothetical protein
MPVIEVPRPFRTRLQKKPAQLQGAIARCIKRLGENPRHPSLQTHPVQGARGVFEAYVDMKNRLTFHWDGDRIVLRSHCDHNILNERP